MSSFLWLSVISYHLWRRLTSLDSRDSLSLFLKYSSFVWGTIAVPTGVIFLMNLLWGEDLRKWHWMPIVGVVECAAYVTGAHAWIYYNGPMLILNVFNLIMFILTTIHIRKVKSNLKKLNREEATPTCFDLNLQT
ncbi:probable G-protein coupled receptor Mth-like 7 [Drosophila ficusphila]|uniref:probable G-protein coupled receptor Mth-like 7 n=1 Tax=Drosophila ficusphila TaxID=30025 RepID=UPI0007E83AD7|nr:probable G-protein coupled receptor Mth-like 7 [Drosophila ficusphila]